MVKDQNKTFTGIKSILFFKTHICKNIVFTFATKYILGQVIVILTLKQFQKKKTLVSQKKTGMTKPRASGSTLR